MSVFKSSGFPINVNNKFITSLDDIVMYRENMPTSFRKIYSGTTTTSGVGLPTFDPSVDAVYKLPVYKWPYIKQLIITADQDLEVTLSFDQYSNNAFYGEHDKTNIAVNSSSFERPYIPLYIKANSPLILKDFMFYRLGYRGAIGVSVKHLTTSGLTYNLYLDAFAYSVTMNTDLNGISWLAIGDSITAGTGATKPEATTRGITPYEPFLTQLKRNFLIQKGLSFWLTNKAQPGATSSSIVQAIKFGYYDIDDAKLITLMIGANDSGSLGDAVNGYGLDIVINQERFSSNIDYILTYLTKRYPDCKIMCFGSTPSHDDSDESKIEISRTIMQNRVQALNNNNVKYYSLSNSFDRTNTDNYLPSDNIHPTAHNSIFNSMYNGLINTGWFD